jgi:glycosyltransferase involved in cell wall biosynthesis
MLQDALRSVLHQTYRDFEVIVVDDGSTDDTRRQIAEFQNDTRLRYLYQENRGLAAARNTGIRASHGEYVALLDDDDLWLPSKLEKQVHLLEVNDQIAVAYCDFRFVDVSGNLIATKWRRPASRATIYEGLMYDNVIAGSGSAVLIRRQCLEEVGPFDESLQASEDQDLWRRIALKHRFGYIDEVLVHIRWHPQSMQRNPERMARGKLHYLEKLRMEVPTRLRNHLPNVTYHTYASIAWTFFDVDRFDEAKPFIRRIANLGPGFLLRFVLTLCFYSARNPISMLRIWLSRGRDNDTRSRSVELALRLSCDLFRGYRH